MLRQPRTSWFQWVCRSRMGTPSAWASPVVGSMAFDDRTKTEPGYRRSSAIGGSTGRRWRTVSNQARRGTEVAVAGAPRKRFVR